MVAPRTAVSGTFATAASANITLPTGSAQNEIQLAWVVVKTATTIGVPSGGGGGWALVWSGDTGGCKASLYARVVPAGAGTSSVSLSPSSDGYIYSTTISSTSTGAVVLDYGQQGYSGSGTEASDASDTYTYGQRGKLNVDTSADTTLAVFAGGKIAQTDIALYFYALNGATVSAAPTLGSYDTSQGSATLPTTTTIRGGAISSTYRVEVGRGFTLSQSNQSVAVGLWISENGAAPGGSGNGSGIINNPPPLYATATDAEAAGSLANGKLLTTGNDVMDSNGTRPWAYDIEDNGPNDGRILLTQASPELKQGQQGGGITVT